MISFRSIHNCASNILANKRCKFLVADAFSCSSSSSSRYLSHKIAIVGSGPAGFYTAQKLLKNADVNVDIFERLPVPFGLIRYGVAPDHPEVKNVINSFTSTVTSNPDRLNFYGNVNFGRDVQLDDLIQAYHAVVLCYGSAQDKLLNIEGEKSKNTISARNFVGWYNGSPEDKDLDIDLNCDTACIIGHGNVALDCARILLQPANLDKTDITTYAQRVLAASKVKQILIIGRRGPAQAAFTIKELRELANLNKLGTYLDPPTIFDDAGVSSTNLFAMPRHRKRMSQLLLELSANRDISRSAQGKRVILKFLAKPMRINVDQSTGKVCGLELQRTRYPDTKSFLSQDARPIDVDEYESIDCGLVIRSIGYKAVMVDKNLPMDTERGAILNTDGRVHGYRNLYCSGWLATGASGVIAGTLHSSQLTSKSILEDIQRGELPGTRLEKPGYQAIERILRRKDIQVVHFNDWLRIDEMERQLGAITGKNREKMVDVGEMLKVARGENPQVDCKTNEHKSNAGSARTKARSIAELMRWHKPTGTILTLTPALWSVGLATPETSHLPDLRTMAIFTAGAIVARGMGCTLNDILDRNIDRHVARTKTRPIACGDISVKEALAYLAVQSTVGLYVLCLNNLAVIKLGLFSGFMIAAYPLFKRFTNWPQVMLALTFNWGVLMGYAAIRGPIGLGDLGILLPIYLGANFWTLYYDTIYAHQDKTDDQFIGVKSSALALGSYTRKFLYQMSGAMFLSLTTAGLMTSQMWPYYLSVAGCGLYQAKQTAALNLDDPEQCWQAFDRQKYVGLTILGGILVSVGLKANKSSELEKVDNQ